MPRKPTPLPPILVRETLGETDGSPMVDDFTGETLGHRIIQPTAQGPDLLQAMADRREARRKIAQAGLENLGLIPRVLTKAPLVEIIPQGKRKIGEIAEKALLVPARPWRRFTKS